jgi:hypothetical protein
VTFLELRHWAVQHREQLFQRVLAERLSHQEISLQSNSPNSHSPRDLLRALSLAGSSQGATLSAHTKKLTNRVSLPGAEKKTEGGFPWSEQEKQERERELSTIPRTNRDQQESEIRHTEFPGSENDKAEKDGST